MKQKTPHSNPAVRRKNPRYHSPSPMAHLLGYIITLSPALNASGRMQLRKESAPLHRTNSKVIPLAYSLCARTNRALSAKF